MSIPWTLQLLQNELETSNVVDIGRYHDLLLYSIQLNNQISRLQYQNQQMSNDIQQLYQWSTQAATFFTKVTNLNATGRQLLQQAEQMLLTQDGDN